ncbi:hypothetical protein AB0M28_13345 [Streptomyces sp. NPDC051940]|uniref:hypothetical protein n=1 Tax=Streptomyces sp. NPDC051940 TaxID=3155675 RepID=UPI00341DFAF2
MATPRQNTKTTLADPHAAVEQLRDALTVHGIVLPSLGVDVGAARRLKLVTLGGVRADVALQLAQALQGTAGGEPDVP